MKNVHMSTDNGHNRLYGDLAWLWPIMSPPEEYADEAGYWLRVLRSRLPSGRRRVLELGTGGGHFLHQLTGEYDATAVDLSEAMLAHSRRLNPGVAHHVGRHAVGAARRDVRRGAHPRRHRLHDDGGRAAGGIRDDAGFAWERVDYPVSADATPMWLWVCELRAE